MGIDGERLVLDYLSKVGDLAHSANIPSAERRELVGKLRDEIGRRRSAVQGQERDADVRRILGGIGRPEEVVAAAGGAPESAPWQSAASATAEEPAESRGRFGRFGRALTSRAAGDERRRPTPEAPAAPAASPGAAEVPAARPAPDELVDLDLPDPPTAADRAVPTEWRDGAIGAFTGGIIEPDMLRPPAEPDDRVAPPPPADPLAKPGDGGKGADAGAPVPATDAAGGKAPAAASGEPGPKGARGLRGALRDRTAGKHAGGPVELFGALLLIGGAVMAELLPMLGGWLLAWWAPRLSRPVAKFAVLGMPALVVGGWFTWLFGRVNEYWGEPLEGEVLRTALGDHWPALLRGAALATALFLLWRSLRRPPGKA
ncbi:hypothetical protein [Streptomyces bohaiensis]|uniref:Integral membrane protein n=1 Tax=Streptomyces bohaiensis TaxID=1431344 RepID=A0ABX1CKR5_9ACTN|nr:hypothetical protein [Streptomyces bohaiensis]NJQ17194.1 hypothetical protein [Streptomyces bohaiensis]